MKGERHKSYTSGDTSPRSSQQRVQKNEDIEKDRH